MADPQRVTDSEQAPADLEQAYADYRSATTSWRAASTAGHPELVDRAAERLLAARVTLYRALTESGWGPPEPVVIQLERDAALLSTPDDFEHLLTAG